MSDGKQEEKQEDASKGKIIDEEAVSSPNWESDIWSIIENYFKTVPNYLSRTQLDSYNIFLSQQIPKTIRQFNPITCLYKPYDEDDINSTHKFKIEIYIGGSPDKAEKTPGIYYDDTQIINDSKRVYINKPIIQEKRYN